MLTRKHSFMRPNTPHYVLTLEHSITLGRHFYAASTMMETCLAYIHCGILNGAITNTDHPDAQRLLNRILLMSIREYKESNSGAYASQTSSLITAIMTNHNQPLPQARRFREGITVLILKQSRVF